MANEQTKGAPPPEGQSPRTAPEPAAKPVGQQERPTGDTSKSAPSTPSATPTPAAGEAETTGTPELPGQRNFEASAATGTPLSETQQQPQPPTTDSSDEIDDLLGLTKPAEPSGDTRDSASLSWPERLSRAGRRLEDPQSAGEIAADEVLIAIDGEKEDAKPKRIIGKSGFLEAKKNPATVFFAVPSTFARDVLGKGA